VLHLPLHYLYISNPRLPFLTGHHRGNQLKTEDGYWMVENKMMIQIMTDLTASRFDKNDSMKM